MNRIVRLVGVIAALLTLALHPAAAQGHDFGVLNDEASGRVESLPPWAEPAARPPSPSGFDGGAIETNSPDPPPPAERIPVDGGLIWLVAAGGAFAVYRLRSE
jgi:hypothetical protein